MVYLPYGLAWVSVGTAVCAGIFITKSATPLWALLISLFISLSVKHDDDKDVKDDNSLT